MYNFECTGNNIDVTTCTAPNVAAKNRQTGIIGISVYQMRTTESHITNSVDQVPFTVIDDIVSRLYIGSSLTAVPQDHGIVLRIREIDIYTSRNNTILIQVKILSIA